MLDLEVPEQGTVRVTTLQYMNRFTLHKLAPGEPARVMYDRDDPQQLMVEGARPLPHRRDRRRHRRRRGRGRRLEAGATDAERCRAAGGAWSSGSAWRRRSPSASACCSTPATTQPSAEVRDRKLVAGYCLYPHLGGAGLRTLPRGRSRRRPCASDGEPRRAVRAPRTTSCEDGRRRALRAALPRGGRNSGRGRSRAAAPRALAGGQLQAVLNRARQVVAVEHRRFGARRRNLCSARDESLRRLDVREVGHVVEQHERRVRQHGCRGRPRRVRPG